VISAIVFDFDGVLADSEPLHLRAYQEVIGTLGESLPREEYYARYLGYDDEGVFRALSDARGWRFGASRIHALVEEKCRVFDALLEEPEILYPGAAECVARLAALWPLGIASGARRHEVQATLTRGGLRSYFRFIVAAGDTPASKPAPDPYLRAATLHGVDASKCVAIEDSKWGIESAKGAGMWCIGITHTYPVAELLAADSILSSLHELTPELIRSLR
jgi:beta-phosphoglucomutase